MNYIQIADKTLPIAFGYGALMAYEKTTGQAVTLLFSAFSAGSARFTDLIALVACGLENGSRKAGSPEAFTPEQVADMLDECNDPTGVITQAMQILGDSFAQPSESAKKKAMKTAKAPRLSGVR